MSVAALSVTRYRGRARSHVVSVSLLLAVAAIMAGVVTGGLSSSGRTLTIIGLEVIFLPLAMWRSPEAAIALLVLSATLIEQSALPTQLGSNGTDEVLFFTSLTDGVGVKGVLFTPLELTIAIILVVWLIKSAADHTLRLPRSPMALGFLIFTAIVVLAEANGLAHGGDLRESFRELRPWVYLGALYLLASQLLRSRRAIWAVLWALVIGTGIKGLQGTGRFLALISGQQPLPDYILAHEEAVFFGLYTLLTAALWIFGKKGRLRSVATALLPAVLIANLANNRRLSWLILIGGFAALLLFAWIRLPHRRRLVKRITLAVVVGSVVYFPLFWNSGGVLGEPARAIRSAVTPSERDLLSNVYRRFENANLMVDIRRSTPWGEGFGLPIDYSAVPFYDLTKTVPSLRYEPHNDILYIWLRLGVFGALAFWWLIGAAFVAGCRLARCPDQQLALFGSFAVCALIAYLVEGSFDLGLTWFRVAVLMGCLLGALEAARRLAATTPVDRGVRAG